MNASEEKVLMTVSNAPCSGVPGGSAAGLPRLLGPLSAILQRLRSQHGLQRRRRESHPLLEL